METIFLTRSSTGTRRIHLGAGASAALVLVVGGLLAVSAVVGYRAAGLRPDPRPDLYAAAWRAQATADRLRADAAIDAAHEDLDALAVKLGELEARAVRVDALGARLVEIAGIDSGEFDFDSAPGVGGPAPGGGDPYAVGDFLADLSSASALLADRETQLRAVEQEFMGRELNAELQPRGRPVLTGWLSSRFGKRSDPVNGRRAFHEGLDFAGRPGSEVVAVASGVVIFAGRRAGYGNVIDIDHGDGLVTRYAHNRRNLVRVGAAVGRGQQIAEMGSTGHTTGPHVHFEVRRDGKAVDPMEFIRARP